MLVALQTLLCQLIVFVLGEFAGLVQADKFSSIPAGKYEIGNMIGDADIRDNPVRSVTLSAYFMAVNDTTKAQWDAVRTWALTHGYTDLAVGGGKASNHPVQTVNWYDVVKWANAASEKDGLEPCYAVKGAVYRTGKGNMNAVTCNWSANGYRLPSEAEWEVAARGGLKEKRFPWALPSISYKKANYSSNGDGAYDLSSPGSLPKYHKGKEPYTSPVGSFAANGFGLYDMAGNVSQWCWDRYGTSYSGGSDPRGAATGSARVLRGGSWLTGWDGLRCAKRNGYGPDSADSGVGFRLVRVLEAERAK